MRNQGFEYKYVTRKNKPGKEKVVYEVVQRKSYVVDQNLVNRTFQMPDKDNRKAHTGNYKKKSLITLSSVIYFIKSFALQSVKQHFRRIM